MRLPGFGVSPFGRGATIGPMGEGRRSAGRRVAARAPRRFRPVVLPLAVGITLCVVAWGYLVKAAIDFGTTARGGDSGAWLYLGLASLGAVACLFIGLMLIARIGRALGWSSGGPDKTDKADAPPSQASGPRPVGGRRRAK
jgi:hypothetical protein